MRYRHITTIAAFCGVLMAFEVASTAAAHQATGAKVGEVTASSAIVWARRTAEATRNEQGQVLPHPEGDDLPTQEEVNAQLHAVPGAPGRLRVRYGTVTERLDAGTTAWKEVDASSDFSAQFRLEELEPATTYFYEIESENVEGDADPQPFTGRFRTAPAADRSERVVFTVVTGQMYRDVDDPDGFLIYDAMAALKPDFLVPTGDTVYYDNERPRARTKALARYHWQRMYGFPRLVAFHRQFPAYWMKDDHDTLRNDCWPTQGSGFMSPLAFEDGLTLFREQVPMGDGPTYRTYRWGRDLQVWLVEGRDFRSPNPMPDGPDKSIWGAEQKAWLKRTMLESDATWKVLLSPTPIVGPDRGNKRDNHANDAFTHEGNEIRRWLAENLPDSAFIACGDRHWQYHSVDPATGVHEFSCGPASDEHAGGSPGQDPDYHRFHRVGGGFLSVTADGDAITFRFHDVPGDVVYSRTFRSARR